MERKINREHGYYTMFQHLKSDLLRLLDDKYDICCIEKVLQIKDLINLIDDFSWIRKIVTNNEKLYHDYLILKYCYPCEGYHVRIDGKMFVR